jgi:integrase
VKLRHRDAVRQALVNRLGLRGEEADLWIRIAEREYGFMEPPEGEAPEVTGLRRGETCALRWPSVDLDSERTRIHVDGTLQRVDGELVVLPPKSSRSRRTVPLPPDLAALLRRHRAEQTERRLLSGPAWHGGEYVFDSGTGRPVDPDALGKAFHAACTTVGLRGARLHDLRHAAATALIEQGTNVRVVADLLGHSAVSFTLQTYVHPDEKAAAAAIERLGEALAWGESGAKRSRR